MIINLKQLFSITGESKEFDYSIEASELSDIKGFNFSSPISVKGKIYNKAGVVYLQYNLSFSMLAECDRCLKEMDIPYSFDCDHIVVPSVSGDNDEYIVADGENLELNEIAVTDMLLQLPTKILCKEECRGLCMVCGAELNEGDCEHQITES